MYGGMHNKLLPTLVIYKALDLVARVTEREASSLYLMTPM